MLKQSSQKRCSPRNNQPPSGGCVLKLRMASDFGRLRVQPPSGGCVLKLREGRIKVSGSAPAAFGRLCVETWMAYSAVKELYQPPSGGCVLKRNLTNAGKPKMVPAAFGRLCVETLQMEKAV